MKKKRYVTPTIDVIYIETESVIACSLPHNGNGHHPNHDNCHNGHGGKLRTEWDNRNPFEKSF